MSRGLVQIAKLPRSSPNEETSLDTLLVHTLQELFAIHWRVGFTGFAQSFELYIFGEPSI